MSYSKEKQTSQKCRHLEVLCLNDRVYPQLANSFGLSSRLPGCGCVSEIFLSIALNTNKINKCERSLL